MAFRRDKRKRLEWKKWLQRHRAVLVECGLPAEAYESPRAWDFFLWEGATPMQWDFLETLDRARMRRLYDFLNAECGGEPGEPTTLRQLRTMLGVGQRQTPAGED